MKLLYGPPSMIKYVDGICNIVNFSSLYEYANNSLVGLIPPNNLGAVSEYDFDVKYMNYILENDHIFVIFMSFVINIFNGIDYYLIIDDRSDWSIMLIESLMKLLQQRYGLNGYYLRDINDYDTSIDTQFNSQYGLMNYDMDKERYLYLYEVHRISNGGYVAEE